MQNLLKLRWPYMHGSAVKRVQELLDIEPLDGIYGPGTTRAVIQFQADNGLKPDGIVGPVTWLHIRGERTEKSYAGEFFDIRRKHPKARLYGRLRGWDEIVGVTLHQTGCNMPMDPEKWAKLNAHYGVTREGLIVHVNDESHMIWHAQGLSYTTVGVEIEGNFPGIVGDMSTLWKGGGPACALTKAQTFACRELYERIYQRLLTHSSQWTRIYGHRQSSDMRTADPGEHIWKEVALDWAGRLNLKEADGGSMFRKGKGKPIPKVWDPRRTVRYR